MKIINSTTVIATGKQMFENGHAVKNEDETLMMWIKWNWFPSNNHSQVFAPMVDCYHSRQEDSTHKISDEEIYFKLPEHERGFDFESFIEKFIKIERL